MDRLRLFDRRCASGLQDVVVAALFNYLDDLLAFVNGAEHDDGYLGAVPEPLTKLDTADSEHANIEQRQVWTVFQEGLKPLLGVGGLEHLEPKNLKY
jgi:hypothetical protein